MTLSSVEGGRHWRWHRCVEQDGGHNSEVRLGAVTLGEEEVQRIFLTIDQAESIDIDVLAGGAVNTAQIDDHLAVNEDPDVVVADELEEVKGGGSGRTAPLGAVRSQVVNVSGRTIDCIEPIELPGATY